MSSWPRDQGGIMTRPPEIQLERSAVAARRGRRLLPPGRYRHPGDIIRLITAGFVLIGASAVTAATQGTYAGASAVVVTAVAPSTTAGRMLAGLVQTGVRLLWSEGGSASWLLRTRRAARRPGWPLPRGTRRSPPS